MEEYWSGFPIVAGLSSLIAAGFAVYFDKKRQKQSKKIEKLNFSSDINSNLTNSIHSIDHSSLSLHEVIDGIKKLVKYTFDLNPDYIIGLNRGGVMVGAYLALSVGLQSKNFLRCCVIFDGDKANAECDFKNISGRVLIVDSIVRSGETMDTAVRDILSKYTEVSSIHTASIVTSILENGEPTYDALSFYVYKAKNKQIRLPWTYSESENDILGRSEHRRKEFQKVEKKKVENLAGDMYLYIDK